MYRAPVSGGVVFRILLIPEETLMPVTIHYDIEHRIVIWEFEGAWTWEEYYAERDAVNTGVEAAAHRVDMIIDMTRSYLLPPNLMSHAGSAARNAPENIGKTVFVGSNAIVRAFFQMFSKLYGAFQTGKDLNFHMVITRDEAYAVLRPTSTKPETKQL
jgi:hypothetical protein